MIILILTQIILGVLSQNCTEGQVFINSNCTSNDLAPLGSSTYYEDDDVKMNFSYNFPTILSEYREQNFITMMIKIDTPSWFGFGIGRNMVVADIWLFQIDPVNKIITVTDCFGKNYTGPSHDVLFGGKNDVQILGYEYNVDGFTTVKFKRLLETGDIHDRVIEQRNNTAAFIAYGQSRAYTVAAHGSNNALFTFDFVEDQNSQPSIIIDPIDWTKYHKWTNLILWGILIDFPIIIARYFKTYSWYINVHGAMMLIITFVTLVAEISMGMVHKISYRHDVFVQNELDRQAHLIIGSSVTILIGFQLLVGIFLRYQILSKTSLWSTISQQKYAHMISGSIIYILAKSQLILGIEISTGDGLPLLYIVFGFTLVWRAVFEFVYRNYEKLFIKLLNLEDSKNVSQDPQNSITSSANLIQHIAQLDFKAISIEFPGKKWAVFNNSVIDLSNHVHPGGQFLWEQVQGREISRFVYGAYCLESTEMAVHKHDEYALKLIEKLTIGKLLVAPLFSIDQQYFTTWEINSQEDLTPSIKIFSLTRQGVTFSTTLNGFENFGRYFLVRSNSNPDIATRPYTMVLCMARCNKEYRKVLIQNALSRLENTGIQTQIIERKLVFQDQFDEFPLIIKRYPSKNGFSQYIHSSLIGDQIQLSGPFGTSFGIQHEQKGQIVLIAGGTGILSFLDLLDFMLKKTLYQLYQEKNFSTGDINPSNIDFQRYFQPQNKFILLFSVKNMSEMVGSEIYLTLARVQKYLKKPNFELIFNYMDGSQLGGVQCIHRRFDHFYIQKNILNLTEVQRFLLSGPPSMIKEISLGLLSLGISKSKVHLV